MLGTEKDATVQKKARGAPKKNGPSWKSRGIIITCYREWVTELPEGVQYIAWGDELCPTTGKPHKQAFAYAEIAQRFAWWAKRFPQCRLAPMIGNFMQNENYCSKAGSYHELGEKPMLNGEHKAKHRVVELMERGDSPVAIAREHGSLTETVGRYFRFWEVMHRDIVMDKLRDQGFKPRQVYIHIGPTQAGKSRLIYEQHDCRDVYIMPKRDGKWYGNYKGQSVVVFNDVRHGDIMSYPDFLNITDGYPIEVEVKGGFVPWCAEYIYFTSNDPVEKWWPHIDAESAAAVKRRVTEVRVFKSDGTFEFE